MNVYDININNTKVGTLSIDYKLDYDISFNCTVESENSNYYLINYQHLGDFDFYAIYKEVLKNGMENYYLFDSNFKDNCSVPESILINEINIEYRDYLIHRDEVYRYYMGKE